MPWTRDDMAARAAKELRDGFYVNLGVFDLLGVPPGDVLHVGDHIEMDAVGALKAGLRSCWINRPEDHGGHPRAWPHDALRPDLEFATLTALADWLDAHPDFATEHAAA